VTFLEEVAHTQVPLSPSSIIWYSQRAVMSCGWKGNRRSGWHWPCVTGFSGFFFYLRTQGLRMETSTPPTLLMGYARLLFTFLPYVMYSRLIDIAVDHSSLRGSL